MSAIEVLLGKFGYVKAKKLAISRVLSEEFEFIEKQNKWTIEEQVWQVPKKHLRPPSHYNYTFHRLGSPIATGYLAIRTS